MATKKKGLPILIKAGVPFVSFMIGGAYMLSTFMQTHMEMKDRKEKSTTKRTFDIEEEHRKMMKQLDIDNYSLSRIPRPEEEAPKTVKQGQKKTVEEDKWYPGKYLGEYLSRK